MASVHLLDRVRQSFVLPRTRKARNRPAFRAVEKEALEKLDTL